MHFVRRLSIIDSHTAGEPTRMVISGFERIPGSTMAERKKALETDFDWLRRAAMHEPRGHRDMFGCVLMEPIDPTAHIGAVYMDGGRFYNMCGHASLGICAMMVETGRVPTKGNMTKVRIDTPAGIVEGSVQTNDDGRVVDVSLIDVPSFAFALDQYVDVPDFGKIRCDIGYGGNFFVIAEAVDLGFDSIDPEHTTDLIKAGVALRAAANQQISVQHPELAHIDEIDIAMITAPPADSNADARNIVIQGDAQADRSPCGTGTCARMSVLHAKGKLAEGQLFRHQSSIRTVFDAVIKDTVMIGSFSGIIPQISCRPYLTGFSELVFDPEDPLIDGFALN